MNLAELSRNLAARVIQVDDQGERDVIARRLRELGFVAGEQVMVRGYGPIFKDPLLVQIGDSRFALRPREAARVIVEIETERGATI